MEREDLLKIYAPDQDSKQLQPLAESSVSAGFPSPADDFAGLKLDLNKELVKNPASTFYARVSGVSMVDEGIDDGDLLVIDKSVEPLDGSLAVCFVDGEFTLKRFSDRGDHGLLIPANSDYQPIRVSAENDFQIWGVVRYIIKKMI
ncbi:MAG: translesion error-prone DNA polymerase V autoproteolytic subunit [Rikenellaceae bacterium]